MQGVYVLLIEKIQFSNIMIGKLGVFNFPKGIYLYVGSALGIGSSTTIENRLKRHFTINKKNFWHIDYLLFDKYTKLVTAYYGETNLKLECDFLQALKKFDEITIQIKQFGSSDCKKGCGSHLLYSNLLDKHQMFQYIKKSFNSINIFFKKYK